MPFHKPWLPEKATVFVLNSLEFLVVQEIFMSETAKSANGVLPGASFFAKSGAFTNGGRRVQRVNEVIPPLAGTKTDGQIVSASFTAWAPGDGRDKVGEVCNLAWASEARWQTSPTLPPLACPALPRLQVGRT